MPGRLLVNPATYVAQSDFSTMALDYDLASYSPAQQTDILVRASGMADSIMRRSLIAQEKRERFYGNGSNTLDLTDHPIIYVKKLQYFLPGIAGYTIPPGYVEIDADRGQIVQYAPLALQGIGYIAYFPEGLPVDITYGTGYGYNPIAPPSWTYADAPASTAPNALTPGTYTIGFTTCTQWGETLPAYQTVTTATGAISSTLQTTLGAYLYRGFLGRGGITATTGALAVGASIIPVSSVAGYVVGQTIWIETPGSANAEQVTISAIGANSLTTSALTKTHASGTAVQPVCSLVTEAPSTQWSGVPVASVINSMNPPPNQFSENAPTIDSSALPLPQEIREAVRLLAMQVIYEQNNLANRGIAKTQSQEKSVTWKSTEGSSGRGVPLYYDQAIELLRPHALQAIF